MTAIAHTASPRGATTTHPVAPKRWWALGFALVVALVLARLPVAIEQARQSVDAAVASGDLPNTDQKDLALSLGISGAILVFLMVNILLFAVARRTEKRAKLPAIDLRVIQVPGLLYLVAGISAAVQFSALLIGALEPRTSWLVWLSAGIVIGAGAISLGLQRAQSSEFVRFALAAAVVTGACLVL